MTNIQVKQMNISCIPFAIISLGGIPDFVSFISNQEIPLSVTLEEPETFISCRIIDWNGDNSMYDYKILNNLWYIVI